MNNEINDFDPNFINQTDINFNKIAATGSVATGDKTIKDIL